MPRPELARDPVTRRLLALIRQGRLELALILADHLEEQGDPRGADVRVMASIPGDLVRTARTLLPPPSPDELARLAEYYDHVRRYVARLFGRHWAPLPPARALRLLGPPDPG
jgi:hypothetical protein